MSEPKTPNTPEPPPKEASGTPVWELVLADMAERHRIGTAKYGRALRAGDGRRSLVDAYQEQLDGAVYLRKAMQEFDALVAAARAAEQCIWDPDISDVEQFDRVAEEFYRATGFVRPGKDVPAAMSSEASHLEREEAWFKWSRTRLRKVLADLRAALKAAGVGT